MSAAARHSDAGFLAHENAPAVEWTPTENDPVGERRAKFNGFSVLIRCNYAPRSATAPHRFYAAFKGAPVAAGVFFSCDGGWEEAERTAIARLREGLKAALALVETIDG